MTIKNFEKLATSSLRKQLLSIAEAGYEAINTSIAVDQAVKFDSKKNLLTIQKQSFDLKKFKRVFVLAFGKAALESSLVLKRVLGQKVYKGIVIDVNITNNFEQDVWIYRQATHPNVSTKNIKAAEEATSIISDLRSDDLIICSISGGGSAIFEIPYKIEANKAADIFKAMTKGGATISELNTVRKHTSLVKGGQLAKHFFPATVVNLIFSDVPGDDLSVIASGPLVKDHSTVRGALSILEHFNVFKVGDFVKIELTETPKEDKYFKNIHNFIVVAPKVALKAMKERAEDLGWDVKIFSSRFEGEARVIGRKVVEAGKKGQCLLGAGESTVKILGKGKGGRNQEMALSALLTIDKNEVFGSFASDGHDYTEAAGAVVDYLTYSRARTLGLNPESYLNNNDSFNFFEQVGDNVYTGLTGSNIADFFILLKL